MSSNTGVLDLPTTRMPTKSLPTQHPEKVEAAPRRKTRERLEKIETKAFSETKAVPGVSVFAIFGTIVISVLMVFVVLAQISYNETASESVRLSAQLAELTERHKALEFAFESSIDIKEIERVAQDELGMSRPDTSQIISITALPRDSATVIVEDEDDTVRGFAEFIRSLTEYFK